MMMHTEKTVRPGEKKGQRKDKGSVGEYQRSGMAIPLYGMTGHFFCDGADHPRRWGMRERAVRRSSPRFRREPCGRL